MTDLLIERGAEISSCGRYRYVLWRRWEKEKPRLTFIMLNPSTADAETDDATIRVCMGRAIRMGFGGIRVLNLFAWRATNPEELRKVEDPIGPEAEQMLNRYAAGNPVIIAGWGDGGLQIGRHRPRWREVCELYSYELGIPMMALGTTKAGHPKHPLRIPYAVAPTLWMDRDRFLRG